MTTQKMQGFTVIEVVLFLAISGLLGIGILGTASSAVNQERYRDSVRTLHGHLQSQYSQVVNVQNGRGGNEFRCTTNGTIANTNGGGGTPQSRGTSDCMVIGRVVDVVGTESQVVRSETVYATYDPMRDPVPPINDVDALRRSRLILAPSSTSEGILGKESYTLEWQTSMATTAGADQQFRLLIVRSPFSGMVRTYAESSNSLQPASTAAVNAMLGRQTEIIGCVSPDGLFTGQKLGVRIANNAASAAGVTIVDGGIC